MQNRRTFKSLAAVAAVAGMAYAAPSADAAIAYALNDENGLVRFDTGAPNSISGVGQVQLLSGDPIQDLIGIDFRPSTGVLYGVGRGRAVYTINPATAIATPVGTLAADAGDSTAPFTNLSGTRFGFDFNPIPDYAGNPSLRILSNSQQNLRVNVNPLVGRTTTDTSLVAGTNIIDAAYTNSFSGGAPGSTTLYGIDSVTNNLVSFTNPNAGTFSVVGPLGVDASSVSGFDIFYNGQTNVGFAAIQDASGGVSRLYTVDLGTGAASLIGTIEGGDLIDGLAVQPIPEPASLGLAGPAAAGLLARRRRN